MAVVHSCAFQNVKVSPASGIVAFSLLPLSFHSHAFEMALKKWKIKGKHSDNYLRKPAFGPELVYNIFVNKGLSFNRKEDKKAKEFLCH